MSVSSCSDAGYLFEDQSAQGGGTDCVSSTAKSQLNTDQVLFCSLQLSLKRRRIEEWAGLPLLYSNHNRLLIRIHLLQEKKTEEKDWCLLEKCALLILRIYCAFDTSSSLFMCEKKWVYLNWMRHIQATCIKIANLTIGDLLSLTPLLHSPKSNMLSVHKHKLNLLLMIVLLTRRGSIHSRRPATTTGQISWRGGGKRHWTSRRRATGRPSELYSQLNNSLD